VVELELTEKDQATLNGEMGDGSALAMRIVTKVAAVMQAPRLVDIVSAHIDGCLYHGSSSIEFVERFINASARVLVPTTLNVGSMDLIHPEIFSGSEIERIEGSRLMNLYVSLGCQASFTCAPYQLRERPRFGDQIAWAESNAIVFANSVLGARTERYGDFLDLAAAITGRVPYAGLHVEKNRAAGIIIRVPDFSRSDHRDAYFAAAGAIVGRMSGTAIPAIVGLPEDTTEDELKAFGAASATTGAVALFHAVGVTPEAPTLEAALQGQADVPSITLGFAELIEQKGNMATGRAGDKLTAVAVGTPHFSIAEFERLDELLSHYDAPLKCDFYVNTSRFILWQLEESGMAGRLQSRGINIVVDTCTYFTPVMKKMSGLIMTNSAKWAYYAPSNIGVRVAYGSLRECVESAFLGHVCLSQNGSHDVV
jgi:predicted aconitase